MIDEVMEVVGKDPTEVKDGKHAVIGVDGSDGVTVVEDDALLNKT